MLPSRVCAESAEVGVSALGSRELTRCVGISQIKADTTPRDCMFGFRATVASPSDDFRHMHRRAVRRTRSKEIDSTCVCTAELDELHGLELDTQARQKCQKHTTPGILRWSPTLILIRQYSAYVWQSGRDAQLSLSCGRMCLAK